MGQFDCDAPGSLEIGPFRGHISPMKQACLFLPILALLTGCSGYDPAKQREACEKAHPGDKAAVDQCVAVADREAARDAWNWFKTGAR